MKFRFDGFQVLERTLFCVGKTNEQKQGGYIHARVMVLWHDTLSECALKMYEVSFKRL